MTLRTWKEALIQVHKFNWEKWQLLKAQYPLSGGQQEQVPGDIPEATFQLLQPTIDAMNKDPTRYYKKKEGAEDGPKAKRKKGS